MTEIYINNELIDLYDAEDIVMSFAVNNLFDIESRDGSYSNTFKIPATHNNNRIFSHFNNPLSITNNAYEVLTAQIYVNQILQVNGFAQMTSATEDEYEIRIFSGNTDWAEAISNINLQDLIPNDFNHIWTVNDVIASRNNTFINCYNYPNIDYGNLFFKPTIPPFEAAYYDLYPAIYCKYLFNRIFERAGYTIESDWYNNDPLFVKQIIPFSAEWKRNRDYTLRDNWKVGIPIDITYSAVSTYYPIPFTNPISYPTNGWQGVNPNDNSLRILDGCICKISWNIDIQSLEALTYAFGINLTFIDGNGISQYLPIYPFGTLLPAMSILNLNGSVNIQVSQTPIELRFSGGLNVVFKDTSWIKFEMITITDELEEDLLITQDYPFVTLGSTLPDLTAKDFIITIANQYGLIFDQDNYEKRVKIFQFDSVVKNIPNALDWSSKLDLSQKPIITNLHDEYQRNNYFKYAKDNTDEYLMLQDGFADWSLVIQFAEADTSQDLFESEFAPVIRIESFANGVAGTGVLEMAYIPIYESGNFQLVNPRMAYIEFDNSTPITIPTFSGPYSPSIQPNVYFEQLRFFNLINNYYGQYSNLINNSKAVQCLIRLNNIDINTLDFRKPIWIEYFGAYFYINEISQYKVTSKDSTEVTLILINS